MNVNEYRIGRESRDEEVEGLKQRIATLEAGLNAKLGVEHNRTVEAERKNKRLLAEVERLTMELNAVTNGEYTKQDFELERLSTELGKVVRTCEKCTESNCLQRKGTSHDRPRIDLQASHDLASNQSPSRSEGTGKTDDTFSMRFKSGEQHRKTLPTENL